ncbi:MAG TPA: hypothetical protein VII09_03995 [Opitutaceae bacterium]
MLQCGHELAPARPQPARRDASVSEWGGPPVNDATFVVLSVAFFAVSAAYARFCDKVR